MEPDRQSDSAVDASEERQVASPSYASGRNRYPLTRVCKHGRVDCSQCEFGSFQAGYVVGTSLDPSSLAHNESRSPLHRNETILPGLGTYQSELNPFSYQGASTSVVPGSAMQQMPFLQLNAADQQPPSSQFVGLEQYWNEAGVMVHPEPSSALADRPNVDRRGSTQEIQGSETMHPPGTLDTRNLICYYWATFGNCQYSDDICLYSHQKLAHGKVAGKPIQRQRGKPSVAGRNAARERPEYRTWRDRRGAPVPSSVSKAPIHPKIQEQITRIHKKFNNQKSPKNIDNIEAEVMGEEQQITLDFAGGFDTLQETLEREAPHLLGDSIDDQQARFQLVTRNFLRQASLDPNNRQDSKTSQDLIGSPSIQHSAHLQAPPSLFSNYRPWIIPSKHHKRSLQLKLNHDKNSQIMASTTTPTQSALAAENDRLYEIVQSLDKALNDQKAKTAVLRSDLVDHYVSLFRIILDAVPEGDQSLILEQLRSCILTTNRLVEDDDAGVHRAIEEGLNVQRAASSTPEVDSGVQSDNQQNTEANTESNNAESSAGSNVGASSEFGSVEDALG